MVLAIPVLVAVVLPAVFVFVMFSLLLTRCAILEIPLATI